MSVNKITSKYVARRLKFREFAMDEGGKDILAHFGDN